MRAFYILCLLFFCASAKAQFSYDYAPSKWTTFLTPGSNGSVNTAGAPNSITITGSDGASATNMDVDYTITAMATGVLSFSWSYHTNDTDEAPQYDIAGVLVNGTFTQLTDDTPGNINQTGSFSTSVTAGNTIGFRLRATDNVFGNATFIISTFTSPATTLPVKLLSFTALKQNAAVQLVWSTAFEKDFSHFVVEHSADAINFSSLRIVKAGAQNGQYNLVDEHPFSGTNFYRLKMVDNDGSADYSKIMAINMEGILQFTILPNPARDQLMFYLNTSSVFTERVSITNMAGVVVAEQNISLSEGINHHRINIASLAKGIYIIKLQTSGVSAQVIKQ
jgi:hypothetical protein